MEVVFAWTGFIILMSIVLVVGAGCVYRLWSWFFVKCTKQGRSEFMSAMRLYSARYKTRCGTKEARQASQRIKHIINEYHKEEK